MIRRTSQNLRPPREEERAVSALELQLKAAYEAAKAAKVEREPIEASAGDIHATAPS